MAQARGNAALAAVIAQTGWSHAQTARAFVRVAVESAAAELAGVGKSHITHWIGGSHETACALRDLGDLPGAVRQFRRSVRTRQSATFTRTHAVTLGYLGAVQARHGDVEEACATWSRSLDAMDGIRSGRTRRVAADMRAVLSQFHHRGIRAVTDLDARAAAYLSAGA